MCKSSRPRTPPPPPPPAPAAAAAEDSAATNQVLPRTKARNEAGAGASLRRRKGRSGLRIDLNSAGTTAGNGLNIPVS